jgi:hypothetical protein
LTAPTTLNHYHDHNYDHNCNNDNINSNSNSNNNNNGNNNNNNNNNGTWAANDGMALGLGQYALSPLYVFFAFFTYLLLIF